MSDVVNAIVSAQATLKLLRDAVGTISSADLQMQLYSKIADLQSQLLDAREQMLEMQGHVEQLRRENQDLKNAAERRASTRPTIKWGCYQFEGEQGLFCTACYDTKGQRNLVTRLPGGQLRMCPVCQAVLGA